MNEKDYKILFDILVEATDDARLVYDTECESFNTKKTIDSIIKDISKVFIIELREHD